MFTGIIQALGQIRGMQPQSGDLRLTVAAGNLDLSDVQLGDSIAVSGACLTVVEVQRDAFAVDVSRETLDKTILGRLQVGSPVNLEKALRLADRLGGHLVAGHVDGVGQVREVSASGRSQVFAIAAPPDLLRYVAAKGSVCVDGISLTVNALRGDLFMLNLIPHTLAQTTAAQWRPGQSVNLEVDLIARYLERWVATGPGSGLKSTVDRDSLAAKGFPV
ncbi:riboflavin synthase [Acidithiobacillus sp. 'AMD consortium']|jgi:riboflavin synthase|uniref:Riboflavin synthase n=2 Tax=Acidithiobacillus ferridurans TaxID=1232575 RepID=A0A2Z6IM82_ACIFI|nr:MULTISPECIES: riboflavin synthase [Acidithiobacillus]MBU2715387.1 riboflavin synthase [Acidithiobacillus ferridurans]MBU2720960.1 riboflavin synthase [Acidithiobacillus ferridurans]MBU2723118.1 riboflavin synthase [Acidithiobacillus ferridurans]MBU2726224.1 riboflavin synthase [Acidithiobacillus ferridurans]MBU2806662.1 riboflavin synthase [Acidithiobacillus ferridurans]